MRAGQLAVGGEVWGLADYVLRAAPAAGSALRLRGRSFRAAALGQVMAERVRQCLESPQEVFVAAGRFLFVGGAAPDREQKLAALQAELDQLAWRECRGELRCDLAWARCLSGALPDLVGPLRARRLRPLEGALAPRGRWNAAAFWTPPAAEDQICPACGGTAPLPGGETCLTCQEDAELGRSLPESRPFPDLWRRLQPALSEAQGEACATDWPILRYLPRDDQGRPLDFAGLADLSPGSRKLLAWVEIDADHAGRAIRERYADPNALRDFTRRLHRGFAEDALALILEKYPQIYPVHGGGDGMLFVGPWDKALLYAADVHERLAGTALSAGIHLAGARTTIRAACRRAFDLRECAQAAGGDRVVFDGRTLGWNELRRVTRDALIAAHWMRRGELHAGVLARITAWQAAQAAGGDGWELRVAPLLAFEAGAAANHRVRDWILRLAGGPAWQHMEVLSRLASLAAGIHQEA